MRASALRLALTLVRRVAGLVPVRRRPSWRREWEAEIRHAWERAVRDARGGRPGARVQLRLLLRTLTCIRDAAWLRRREWTMTWTWMDLRVAARSLRRRPGFSASVILTLAVGIGANAAIFTLLNGVVLKDLPYPAPEELVAVWHRAPGLGAGVPRFNVSDGYFIRYREESRSFEEMGGWVEGFMTLTGQGEPQRIAVNTASPSLFPTLGLPLTLGRTFLDEEARPDAAPVAILGHGFWRDRFGGDPGVLGRTVTLNGISREIVGVAPAALTGSMAEARVWVPMTLDLSRASPSAFNVSVVARLRDGVTVEDAGRDLTRVLFTMPDVFPDDMSRESYRRLQMSTYAIPLKDDVVGEAGETLWVIQGALLLVLLIAWANASSLMLVRSESRERELAVRRAVGAGRLRLFRHFLSEGGLLACAAGALALLLAFGGIRAFVALGPESLPRLGEVGLGAGAVAFGAGLAVLSALLLALIPAVRKGPGVTAGLRAGGRGQAGTGPKHRVRSALVAAQVALSVVLLVGSGLLLRSFQELRSVDMGFRSDGILTMQLTVNRSQYPTREEARSYWTRVVRQVRELSGVESAALVGRLPLEQQGGFWGMSVEGRPREPGEIPDPQMLKTVSTDYFRTLGVELLEGRAFRESDLSDPASVAVVNRELANYFWPGRSPLGERISLGGTDQPPRTVVGVVDDVRERGLSDPAPGALYALMEPEGSGWQTWSMHLAVRTGPEPEALIEPVQRAVWAVDSRVPVTSIRTMETVVSDSVSSVVFTMLLMAVAAGISLFLGVVGLYGVVSYVVAGRTREIGVRMALGARSARVRAMVLRQGMGVAALGVALGVGVSLAAGRVVESLLFEVSPRDPVTYAVVPVLLLLVAAAACFVPARRASRVDPSVALRGE